MASVDKQVNPMLAASLLGGNDPANTWTSTQLAGRYKSKWVEGFLGGTGSTSQFQSVNQALPVLPSRTNYDLTARVKQANGMNAARTPIKPSWRRDYAFAPGLGVDAARSKITWTDANAGINPQTGQAAPLVVPGKDYTETGPAPPTVSYNGQGLGVMLTAPHVMGDDCTEELRRKI